MADEQPQFLREPFVIDDSKLNSGLRGFPVGTCRTSAVSPTEGVSYAGYPVADLAHLPCEDVIYLLFHKELPTADQAKAFRADLARRAVLPEGVFETMAKLPKQGHPMEWFNAGLLLLGMTGKSPTGDVMEDALNCVARTSAIVAATFRLKQGWGPAIQPRTDVPFHEAFADAIGAPDAHEVLAEFLRLFYVLHMDHGGGNLSTFTAKAVASGHADVYSSMAGGMAALYGPRHGRANQECLAFVKKVGTSDRAEVEKFVRQTMAEGNVVYGFGHAVLRAEDPRAKIQYEFGAKHFPDSLPVQTAIALREVVPPILKENPKISNPYPNVDAVSGSLLDAVGLKDPEFYTLLFGWSRVSGIAAQIVDERSVLRGGKGVPIYRPKYIAEGQTPRRL